MSLSVSHVEGGEQVVAVAMAGKDRRCMPADARGGCADISEGELSFLPSMYCRHDSKRSSNRQLRTVRN